MTHTASFEDTARAHIIGAAPRTTSLPLGPVILLSLLAICLISLPNMLDPMIRHDDYPALLGHPELFWDKTLHEGRWLNYIWHLRGVVTPAWLNFAVYQALWAVLAASLAVAAMGHDKRSWFVTVLALFILVSSPATLISLWFNTLIPGLAVVALYAVLGCTLPQRTHRALLPLFVVVSFWAYTTYPLILLTVCLLRSENRSLRDLFGLMTLFVFSFALAILLTYTINWQVHGIFGVPLDDWREATPATGIAGLIDNLPVLLATFKALMVNGSYNFVPAAYFHIGLLIAATLVLIRLAPREALYLHAGLIAGLGLTILQVLKLGAVAPPRAFIYAWIFYAVIVVRAAALLSNHPGLAGRIARNLALLVVLSYLLQTFSQYSIYRPWQAETRAMADVIRNHDGPVLVYGDVLTLDSARGAHVQYDTALNSRMEQLTGRGVTLCARKPDLCATQAASGNAMKIEVLTLGDVVQLGPAQNR